MTVKQAAERLEISVSLVYSLIASRKLRFCRVGNGRGRIRIPDDAIEEYLARCTFAVEEEKTTPSIPRFKHLRLS
jgi:excisionase family DNA binding protein